MKIKKYLVKYTALFVIMLIAATFTAAQKPVQPRQEKLLNGLKLLMWNEPTAEKVTVKLRVHSGAAFDTANKEGTMALLADALFPNESVREFFRDDLNGSLDVTSNFDYIQINATGSADQILAILDTLATAVTKPPIDKDTTAKIRAARLEKIKELEKNPAYVADLTAAKQLFGTFPYGKSSEGTAESLAKIDFADLLLAKQRFLTADNTTVAVSGNIKYDYVFKIVRQLFGGWGKSDKKIPATFAEPSAPNTTVVMVKSPDGTSSELRFVLRGAARNDKDFWAAKIFAQMLTRRNSRGAVRQNSNLLSGIFTFSLSTFDIQTSIPMPQMTKMIFNDWFNRPLKPEDFAAAKEIVLSETTAKNVADYWLDIDTYKLAAVKSDAQAAQDATFADVQRVAERIGKEPLVTVLMLNEKNADAPSSQK